MKQSHRPTAEAFERLCAPYSGMVYRHCLHMLGNPHEAEDAAQESMLRAFRAFDAFRVVVCDLGGQLRSGSAVGRPHSRSGAETAIHHPGARRYAHSRAVSVAVVCLSGIGE